MERLQKILSQAGVASRRASERLIVEGRVTVNGVTVHALGTKADPSLDDIRVDGRRIKAVEHHRYILLNKPRGYVTTRSDPQRRPTVVELIGARDYIYPVGRLDFDSEGLLILTNDGDLAARLTHPSHGVARVYEARVLGVPDDHDLRRLARGIAIEGRRTEPAEVRRISPPASRHPARHGERNAHTERSFDARGRHAGSRPEGGPLDRRLPRVAEASHATLEITVREGRNRQVRKMCDAIGHPVDRLTRVAIGPVRDSNLKVGQWRELRPEEVASLRRAAGEGTIQK